MVEVLLRDQVESKKTLQDNISSNKCIGTKYTDRVKFCGKEYSYTQCRKTAITAKGLCQLRLQLNRLLRAWLQFQKPEWMAKSCRL